jgi:hypothetical protein
VLSGGFSLKYPMFMSIIHLDNGDEMINLRNSQTTLLCRLSGELIGVVIAKREEHEGSKHDQRSQSTC